MDTSSRQELDLDITRWRLRDHPWTSLRCLDCCASGTDADPSTSLRYAQGLPRTTIRGRTEVRGSCFSFPRWRGTKRQDCRFAQRSCPRGRAPGMVRVQVPRGNEGGLFDLGLSAPHGPPHQPVGSLSRRRERRLTREVAGPVDRGWFESVLRLCCATATATGLLFGLRPTPAPRWCPPVRQLAGSEGRHSLRLGGVLHARCNETLHHGLLQHGRRQQALGEDEVVIGAGVELVSQGELDLGAQRLQL